MALYNSQSKPPSSLLRLLGVSAIVVPPTALLAPRLKSRDSRESTPILVRTPRLVGSAAAGVLRLNTHRESTAVAPRGPGRGVETAVTLVCVSASLDVVLLGETAVAVSNNAAATTLGFGERFAVEFDGVAYGGGDAETADSNGDNDANDDHGVTGLGLAAVDVAGEQVCGAGAGEERCGVGAVEVGGARAAVAHDPGADDHVEAGS